MSKLTKSAKGQDCQIRIQGICNFNPETVVLAHLNGGGMGIKHNDIHGAFACSACHDAIDRRTHKDVDQEFLELAHLQGMVRSQMIMLEMGLIKI